VTKLPPALFTTPLPGINRPLSASEGNVLVNYVNILVKWQRTHRLVGSVEPLWIVENVFVHSLCFLHALPHSVRDLADIGSGAGVPGIPLAIVKPELRMTLIEARQRRVSFLSTAVRELGLGSIEVVGERVERLGVAYESRFDAVVMRCAGEVSEMLAAGFRLARSGGVVVVSAHSSAPRPVHGEKIVVRPPSGRPRTFWRFVKP
jgi:16S rRNA (guanine527-N7)-methyltransferase